jgi:hypothetical protein
VIDDVVVELEEEVEGKELDKMLTFLGSGERFSITTLIGASSYAGPLVLQTSYTARSGSSVRLWAKIRREEDEAVFGLMDGAVKGPGRERGAMASAMRR